MDAITGFVDEYLSTFDPREIIKPQGWNRNFFGVPNFNRKVMYKEGQYQVECLDWPPHAIIQSIDIQTSTVMKYTYVAR